MSQKTVRETSELTRADQKGASGPGLVLVFSGARPYFLPFALSEGGIELGRDELLAVRVTDDRASRRHLAVERADDTLVVRDLGSTNGVFVNGVRVADELTLPPGEEALVRIGHSLFLIVHEIEPFERAMDHAIVKDGIVAGPTLVVLHRKIEALGNAGEGLFIRGESGSGKEIAANLFHSASPRRSGPLVAVNCATIPKDLAERLLFGAVRGAYSGAVTDSQGYLQAARGGTLFLDEVAELNLSVQAKLLRVLETKEITPLGSTRSQTAEFGLCCATHRDLRDAVATQSFREDLYYRIGRPEVRVPPLRERREEIPYFIDQTVRAAGLSASWSLVEDCLLRPWPGNIRELCAELRAAGVLAAAEGAAVVQSKHLGEHAGRSLGTNAPNASPLGDGSSTVPGRRSGIADAATPKVPEPVVAAASATLGLAHKTVLKLLPSSVLLALSDGGKTERVVAPEFALQLKSSAADALFELMVAEDFNQTSVAQALGVSRTTLIKLMDDLHLPRATDLTAEEISRAAKECDGDIDATARLLRVSPSALKRRLTQLDLKLG